MTRPPDITNLLPPPGYGRGRVAAIIEAATGRSPLGSCHLRMLREQRARMVAEFKILFGNGGRRTKKSPCRFEFTAFFSNCGFKRPNRIKGFRANSQLLGARNDGCATHHKSPGANQNPHSGGGGSSRTAS